MASTRKELDELHKLVTKSYKSRIEQDIKDNIPTDAATLSGAVKFLKDNCISADPADTDDLDDLRKQLTESVAAQRRAKGTATLALVQDDINDLMVG